MAIKSSERTALTRILNNRFDLLEQDIEQRRDEIALLVRDRMQDDAREAIRRAEESLQPFVQEARDLERRVQAHIKEIAHRDEVAPGRYHERYESYEVVRSGKKLTKKKLVFHGYIEKKPIKVDILDEWTPVDLEKKINDAVRKLQAESGAGKLNLRKMRAELEEKILLGQIETDEARELLGQIPDVDAVLPPLEEVTKMLESKR